MYKESILLRDNIQRTRKLIYTMLHRIQDANFVIDTLTVFEDNKRQFKSLKDLTSKISFPADLKLALAFRLFN